MAPVKAVLDTNVLVSAFLKATGQEALIFALARSRRFVPVVSDALIQEYRTVLGRPGFGFNAGKVALELRDFLKAAEHADPPPESAHAAFDPDDHMVLDCAVAGGAAYVVTGNTRHFPKKYKSVGVMAPRAFLVVLAAAME